MDRYDNQQLRSLASQPAPVDVTAPGLTVRDANLAVLAAWGTDDPRTAQTVTRMGEIALRFQRRLEASGTELVRSITATDTAAFIAAPGRTGDPPSPSTRRFRRTTLRAWFRTLRNHGADLGDPTLDVAVPAPTYRRVRPLTDDEIVLCREAAFSPKATDLRRPAAWALAEATALTSEIPRLRVGDLDHPTRPAHIALPGTRRVRARTVELTDWGAKILARRLDELAPSPGDQLLVYRGRRSTETVAAQAAACNLIAIVLETAGLDRDDGVRPGAVRLWRAASDHSADRNIYAAANLLGSNSLDDTAVTLGWDWKH